MTLLEPWTTGTFVEQKGDWRDSFFQNEEGYWWRFEKDRGYACLGKGTADLAKWTVSKASVEFARPCTVLPAREILKSEPLISGCFRTFVERNTSLYTMASQMLSALWQEKLKDGTDFLCEQLQVIDWVVDSDGYSRLKLDGSFGFGWVQPRREGFFGKSPEYLSFGLLPENEFSGGSLKKTKDGFSLVLRDPSRVYANWMEVKLPAEERLQKVLDAAIAKAHACDDDLALPESFAILPEKRLRRR